MSTRLTVVVAALAAATIAASHGLVQAANNGSPRRHVVEIHKFRFVPSALTIQQGDTVEWINRDIVPHTATENNKEWDTRRLIKDQSGRITFSSPGVQAYFCFYHPNMRGEITVSAN